GRTPVFTSARPRRPCDNEAAVRASRATPSTPPRASPWGLGGSDRPVHFFQSFAFGFNIGARVDIGRVEALVSKPTANHRHVNLCRDQTHGCSVPEPVG